MEFKTPEELRYTKDHEWISSDGDVITIGITDFAQSQLGDIVFVELPEVGTTVENNSPFGVVESIKSVSDLIAPVSGEIVEVNTDLDNAPEQCNSAPFKAWMIKIRCSNLDELDSLLSAQDYLPLCQEN
ncbi:MAG: glycine cleavage system protein GcvH [Bdellovibrionales bacterium]|jgi:glycine cleavage system H protein|nr:glycine cleavage system protein GcvH [Bdellovibrionales bacterium]MBT3525574.1 glycine cleavage system protein GcvH [Bdellovibrionales bacterium]MBT7669596.1 glycine cleavage system protein GcvH [Bdellovibrionales bacterium]